MTESVDQDELIALTADIVAAYVSNNDIAATDLSDLIGNVHQALLQSASGTAEPEAEPLKPAVPVKKSVHPDYIVCLEDGRQFKSLRRHLRSRYNLTPEQYREKWGLPADYPMVAPNYAETRSKLAKEMRLGHKRTQPD